MKDQKSEKKKSLVAVGLTGAILIAGAFAFLTATDSKTNKFTVGKAGVEVTEPAWESAADLNSNDIPDFAENIDAGAVITKDPYIHNTSEIEEYVYAAVKIPTITDKYFDEETEALVTPDEAYEAFTLLDADGNAQPNSGWTYIGSDLSHKTAVDSEGNTYVIRYYAYNTALNPDDATDGGEDVTTLPVFSSVKFANITSESALTEEDTSEIDVDVAAYAIQAEDSADSAVAAWALVANQLEVENITYAENSGLSVSGGVVTYTQP